MGFMADNNEQVQKERDSEKRKRLIKELALLEGFKIEDYNDLHWGGSHWMDY